jgi:hypothetical protein
VCIDRLDYEYLETIRESYIMANAERNALREQVASLTTQRDEAVAAVAEMREGFEKLRASLIRRHDYCSGDPKTCLLMDAEEFIGGVLESAPLGADILQRMKEQDAALAGMREALEEVSKYLGEACRLCKLDHDATHCPKPSCSYKLAISRLADAFATNSGASTLAHIRGLEADNTHLRAVIEDATHVRPAVLWFACEMERQLKANDHKGGWSDCTDDYLLAKLDEEVGEVKEAVQAVDNDLAYKSMSFGERGDRGGLAGLVQGVIHESADAANIAMMIADNARRDTPDLLGGERRG